MPLGPTDDGCCSIILIVVCCCLFYLFFFNLVLYWMLNITMFCLSIGKKQDCHSNWKIYCHHDEHWGYPCNWISDVRLAVGTYSTFLIEKLFIWKFYLLSYSYMHWLPICDVKFFGDFVKVEIVKWMHWYGIVGSEELSLGQW